MGWVCVGQQLLSEFRNVCTCVFTSYCGHNHKLRGLQSCLCYSRSGIISSGDSGKNLLPGSFRLFANCTLCRCRNGGLVPCWKSCSASPLLLSIVTAALPLILRLQIPLTSLLPPPCLNLVLWQPQEVLCFSERSVWSNYYWPQGMWGLISLSRDWTHTPGLEAWSLNHWTARQVPWMIKWYPLR